MFLKKICGLFKCVMCASLRVEPPTLLSSPPPSVCPAEPRNSGYNFLFLLRLRSLTPASQLSFFLLYLAQSRVWLSGPGQLQGELSSRR